MEKSNADTKQKQTKQQANDWYDEKNCQYLTPIIFIAFFNVILIAHTFWELRWWRRKETKKKSTNLLTTQIWTENSFSLTENRNHST